MYIDLNVPIPSLELPQSSVHPKKGKSQAKQPLLSTKFLYSSNQLLAFEERVDLLTHLGYTVLAFNQVVHKRVDPKNHINLVDGLVEQLKKRPGVLFLKRITIVLDEDSEKGFGLASSAASLFSGYDIIALAPTTLATLSVAALTHSQPSALTAHVISLPLTLPRLPFHLKHTLVRTAIKNGAVFEINYAGALGSESDGNGVESMASIKRNWWASAREVVRVTTGKGMIVSGGVLTDADLRAPRDISNLMTMLDLAQDLAQAASSRTPRSLILRAQTRKAYRAILSEPVLIIPCDTAGFPEGNSQDTTPEPNPTPLPHIISGNQRKRPLEESCDPNSKDEGVEKIKKKNKKR